MRSQVAAFKAHELHAPGSEPELGDLRFRALMSEADWLALPASIRRRFSKRLAGGGTVVYVGETLANEMSRAGWLLAQAARLIGGPLPLVRDAHAPSVVTVTEDVATRGQHWTRLYARRRGFPQVVHSSKRFAGSTGLEEYVGYGIGMALTVHVEAHVPEKACPGLDPGWAPVFREEHAQKEYALVFRAAHYFFQIGPWRIRLPRWASPGSLSVTHAELGDGRFLFKLDIIHPRLGRLICQTAAFQEAQP
jgi:Domain of unknown function (DUF4166)